MFCVESRGGIMIIAADKNLLALAATRIVQILCSRVKGKTYTPRQRRVSHMGVQIYENSGKAG